MSNKSGRQKGSWLPIALGIVAGALLIRYASSSEWWQRTFDRGQGFRTVNSGVSVQVAELTPPTAVPEQPSTTPPTIQPIPSPSPSPTAPPDRMW